MEEDDITRFLQETFYSYIVSNDKQTKLKSNKIIIHNKDIFPNLFFRKYLDVEFYIFLHEGLKS